MGVYATCDNQGESLESIVRRIVREDINGDLCVQVCSESAEAAASSSAEYVSPFDFTATYHDADEIALTNLPITISDDSQLVYIVQVRADNTSDIYIQGINDVTLTWDAVNGRVQIHNAGTPFLATDTGYAVGINAQQKAYDPSTDTRKVIEQAPLWARYTDVEELIQAAQELDTTPTDLGAEIDMRGYNQLGVWLTVDIGTSTDVSLRILHKHESAGAEEYREIYLGNPAANVTTINLNDYQVGADTDQLFKINIPTGGTTPYIQLQVFDAADGTGQIDAAYITKAWE